MFEGRDHRKCTEQEFPRHLNVAAGVNLAYSGRTMSSREKHSTDKALAVMTTQNFKVPVVKSKVVLPSAQGLTSSNR